MPRRSPYADALLAYAGLAFVDGAERSHRGRWRDHFRARIGDAFAGRLVVDLGCNDASLISAAARRDPSMAFIGIDWSPRHLAHAAGRITEAALPNIALVHARAADLPAIFAPGEVTDLWLFHPEPPDPPHVLPMIDTRLLRDIAGALCASGWFTLKTDDLGVYRSALDLLGIVHPVDAATDAPALATQAPDAATDAPAAATQTTDATPDEQSYPSRAEPARVEPARAEPARPPMESASASEVSRLFELKVRSADFWNDPAAQACTDAQPFAGLTTTYERRFVRKRLPIYCLAVARGG